MPAPVSDPKNDREEILRWLNSAISFLENNEPQRAMRPLLQVYLRTLVTPSNGS